MVLKGEGGTPDLSSMTRSSHDDDTIDSNMLSFQINSAHRSESHGLGGPNGPFHPSFPHPLLFLMM